MTTTAKPLTPEEEAKERAWHPYDPHEAGSCMREYPCSIPRIFATLDAERAARLRLERELAALRVGTFWREVSAVAPLALFVEGAWVRNDDDHSEDARKVSEATDDDIAPLRCLLNVRVCDDCMVDFDIEDGDEV